LAPASAIAQSRRGEVMKNIIVVLIIFLIGWKGYEHFQQRRPVNAVMPAKE
jgi:hypothetical protein